MLGVCLHLLQGTSFIYQGEEIGMTNVAFSSKSEIRDIESIQFLKNAEVGNYVDYAWNGILKKGRDNARTPMQWDNSNYAGFSNVTPWIMVNPNYKTINVASQMEDTFSVLYFYKNLILLKTKTNALLYGDFNAIDIENPDFFIYSRQDELELYYVICNMTKFEKTLLVNGDILGGDIVLANYQNKSNTFFPFETRVYKITK
jgi:glycosidase